MSDLLAAADPDNPITNLLTIADTTDSPRALVAWLRHSPGAEWIRQLSAAETYPTHRQLDELVAGKPGVYFRHLLVLSGVLPGRDEYTEGNGPWLASVITPGHPGEKLIQQFAQWSVFRRARRRRRDATENSQRWARQRILVARDFLTWLDDRGRALHECRQTDIDLWLATGSTRRYTIRDFIHWAQKQHHLAADLTVPLRATRSVMEQTTADERWAILKRLLKDDSLASDIRVAGTLVLLFAQHVSRVVMLRTEAVDLTSESPTILLGDVRIVLPSALTAVLQELLAQSGRGHSAVARDETSKRWLFPGGQPGQHVTAEHMRTRLGVLGIQTRVARNTALVEFTQDLPSAVLASLLGMHVNTAVGWRMKLQVDYADFIAARKSELSH